MGVNVTHQAHALIAEKLRYRIAHDPTGEFAVLLGRIGYARFAHAVELTDMWAREGATGKQKHARLLDVMRFLVPQKTPGTKFRSPARAAAEKVNRYMDDQLAVAMALDD